MKVRIPTPLRSYTADQANVHADGATIAEALEHLDACYPGIRFRIVDEQGRLRPHMNIFVNRERERDLRAPLEADDEVVIMQALSGG